MITEIFWAWRKISCEILLVFTPGNSYCALWVSAFWRFLED